MNKTSLHHTALAHSIEGLLGDSSYADATIVCGDREWKVHKAVVCTRSEFLKKAFDGRFKEAVEGTVTLKEDHPNAVAAMLRYIYSGDYNDEAHNDDEDGNWKALAMNVHVYAIGDKYSLTELTQLAITKFSRHARWENTDAPGFLEAITALYTDDEDRKEPLRRCLMRIIMRNGKVLLARKDFQDLAKSLPIFATALFCETFRLENLKELQQVTDLTTYCCPNCRHEFAVTKADSQQPWLAGVDSYYCYHCAEWFDYSEWGTGDLVGCVSRS